MNAFARAAQSALRFVAGLILFCPGAMKLFGWFGGLPAPMHAGHLPPLLLAAGILEVVGGSLLMLGLFTRPVAFVISGEMAFAYFIGHFPRGFWPVQNHGEPAVLLCFIFLYLSGAGAGPLSLDALIQRKRTSGGA